MKKLSILILLIAFSSCKKEVADFTLLGHIKGLKKGTVYLQKFQDSVYITLDSLTINGNSNFELTTDLKEPEMLFLRLNKNDNDEGIIPFFANKGITEISSTLKNFIFEAKVKGSKQHELLEEYIAMMSKFNDKNLDLIKERFESKNENDTLFANQNYQDKLNNLVKRKYLYTINFAVNHPDSEVSPYLALTEIPNTSIKFLDTIYSSLNENIKKSQYGKQLNLVLKERKE